MAPHNSEFAAGQTHTTNKITGTSNITYTLFYTQGLQQKHSITCSPAGVGGYCCCASCCSPKCPSGCSNSSLAIWLNTVLLMRQQLRPAAFAAAIAATVASVTSTCRNDSSSSAPPSQVTSTKTACFVVLLQQCHSGIGYPHLQQLQRRTKLRANHKPGLLLLMLQLLPQWQQYISTPWLPSHVQQQRRWKQCTCSGKHQLPTPTITVGSLTYGPTSCMCAFTYSTIIY